MNVRNKHNLSRSIPPEISLKIRQQCGFGCVICGAGLTEYEHVDPEFKDATKHDPACMTLLCPTCHAKKTRGFLSKQTIKKAMLNPKALEIGYSKEVLDIGNGYPIILFAGGKFINCRIPLMISNTPMLEIKPPEVNGGPFRISAIFKDYLAKTSLIIVDNEWKASSNNWDLETKAGKIIIKDVNGQIILVLKTIDSKILEIERIVFFVGNRRIVGDRDCLKIFDKITGIITHKVVNYTMQNCVIGINF